MTSYVLDVRNLSTTITTRNSVLNPVDDVSFTLRKGDAVGLVGESGSGKSMTAFSVLGLPPPPAQVTAGQVLLDGRDIRRLGPASAAHIRGAGIAMVFQDPMTYLNPLQRIGKQIEEVLVIHHPEMSRRSRREEVTRALRQVSLEDKRIERSYPYELSGGMRQRVVIAMAVVGRPLVLLADEPTTALDVTVQQEVMTLLNTLRSELQIALLLITHDLALVAEYCDRVYVMYAGRIVESGTVDAVFREPTHPYTEALIAATPGVTKRVDSFVSIPGSPPNLAALPLGCRFAPRCAYAFERCRSEEPPLFDLGVATASRCWLREG